MMRPVGAGPLAASRAVCSFFVAFSALGLETSLQRLWCSIMRLLASWGGTMQWQSCHKEHSMFRVSAPPKPQTPGPSRPVPSGPARRLARVNSRLGDDDGRRIAIWH